MQNLNLLLQKLTQARIEFVIVGGYAAVLHGSSLVTRDLDLCILLDSASIEKLRQTLSDIHPRHRMTPQKLNFLEVPTKGQSLQNLYLETDLGAVDFLTTIKGVGNFQKVSEGADEVLLFGIKVKVINLEKLIVAKSAMNREKDRRAVQELQIIASKKSKN